MHINRVVIGGFANNYYWSSTEATNDAVWVQNFYDGFQDYYFKERYLFNVRAVRDATP
jgi:hypothetical protein